MWSVTTTPSTESPRNSRRSFEASSVVSAHHDLWAMACWRSSTSPGSCPSRRASASISARHGPCGSDSSGGLELGDHVVDGVTDGLEILQVLVLDPEPHRPLPQLLLETLDQLDEGERVGVEVLGERGALADGGGVDLQDVGELVADYLEDLATVERAFLDMGLSGHCCSWGHSTSGSYRYQADAAVSMIPEPAFVPRRRPPGPAMCRGDGPPGRRCPTAPYHRHA